MKHRTDGEELEFQPVVHVPGYRLRTLIPIDVLYDPHVVDWIEPDGRVAICDVGGRGRHTEYQAETVTIMDGGTINQSQSIYDHPPHPHDARLQFRGENGELHDLVTGLRSGRNDILFAGVSLIISPWGKLFDR